MIDALDSFVLVVVGADEARHHDHAPAVDLPGTGVDVGADCYDLLAFDQHVGLFEIAHRRIEREHDAALQQDPVFVTAASWRVSIPIPPPRPAVTARFCLARGRNVKSQPGSGQAAGSAAEKAAARYI